MSRTVAFLLVLALAVTSCGRPSAPAPPGAPPKTPGEPTLIVAFGDSLTSGLGIEDPDEAAWPAVLESALRSRGWDVRIANAGVSGNTTSDALSRVDFSVPPGARIVIILLGANDTFRGKKLDEIERNLDAILESVRAKGAVAVLCGMKTFTNLGPFYARGFESLYPEIAERHDAVFAPFPLDGVAAVPAMNQADGIHPNEEGHRRIAENLLPRVEEALRRR